MASSTSLTLSQAALSRAALPRHGSSSNTTAQSSLSLPTFSGLKSTSTSSTRASSRPRVTPTRRHVISNSAVETLEKTDTALVDKSVNTIRFLAIDAVEKANSGHPGLPMGCALMGHILYDEVMRYNPKNPYWFNRIRVIQTITTATHISVKSISKLLSHER